MLTEYEIMKTLAKLNAIHMCSRVPEMRKQEEILKDTFLGDLEAMSQTVEGAAVINNLPNRCKLELMKVFPLNRNKRMEK